MERVISIKSLRSLCSGLKSYKRWLCNVCATHPNDCIFNNFMHLSILDAQSVVRERDAFIRRFHPFRVFRLVPQLCRQGEAKLLMPSCTHWGFWAPYAPQKHKYIRIHRSFLGAALSDLDAFNQCFITVQLLRPMLSHKFKGLFDGITFSHIFL